MPPQKKAPRHVQIADRLRGDIQSGHYALGAQLPIEAELATLFDTSRPTLRQALAALAAEGLIVRRPRTGSVVVACAGGAVACSHFGERTARLSARHASQGDRQPPP